MAKMISLFGSVSSSRSELMRVGEVQCHWLTLNEAFMADALMLKVVCSRLVSQHSTVFHFLLLYMFFQDINTLKS